MNTATTEYVPGATYHALIEPLQRALAKLGFPTRVTRETLENNGPRLYTTPEGLEAAKTLRHMMTVNPTRHPDEYTPEEIAAFRAARNLEADLDTLTALTIPENAT